MLPFFLYLFFKNYFEGKKIHLYLQKFLKNLEKL